uniref:Uncharacterized protein n=1 Tax=Arundo donax TaxID=35708 RepID=A0A0A9BHL8_ARUDO
MSGSNKKSVQTLAFSKMKTEAQKIITIPK